MKHWPCFPLALVALALALPCHAAADPPAHPIERIKLERTGCELNCRAYTLEIAAGGAVSYAGADEAGQAVRHTAALSPGDFEFLLWAIERAQFYALRERYAQREDGCAKIRPGYPSILITVRAGGAERTVNYYSGCEGPQVSGRIGWLAATLDEVAGTSQWVWRAPAGSGEPLHTESFPLAYARAEELAALLSNGDPRILSARGSVSANAGSNTLFAQDTPPSLREVRRLVRQLDTPAAH